MLRILLSILLIFMVSVGHAEEMQKPLSADQAFVFSSSLNKNNQLVLKWEMAPGYYLYKDQFTFTPAPTSKVKIGAVALPEGHAKQDSIRGNYQTYTGSLQVPVSLVGSEGQLVLGVSYQGCSEDGFCYPPLKKYISLNISGDNKPVVTNHANAKRVASNHQKVANLLMGGHPILILLSFLGLGILLAFTPCVLPMVPILSSIIVGQGKSITTSKAFFLSLTYVLGMALMYAAAGMMVASLGGSLQVQFQKPWVILLFSGLFVLLALSLFGFYELSLPRSVQQRVTTWSNKQKGGTYISVFLMGALSALIVSPCVSAPLVGVLAYIAESGNVILGGVALLALGLGMGIPLLLIGVSAGKLLPKAGPWMEGIKKFCGVLMLGLAILMLGRILPGTVTLLLWAALFVGSAVFMGAFNTAHSHLTRLNKGIGLVCLMYATVLMVGAVLGNSDPFRPLAGVKFFNYQLARERNLSFTVLQDMSQLNQQLEIAKADGKPVIIDFYADWCASCITMDNTVFTHPKVKRALQDFVLLRANVTDNNGFDQALLKRFNVIAPPTVLFFNREGGLVQSIAGEVDAKEFLGFAQTLG